MKNIFVNIFLSMLSLLFTVLILEIGARVYNSEYNFHNFVETRRDLLRSAYPAEFDKQLGWVPKKGSHPRNAWNTKVTILNDGIRSNGGVYGTRNGETILAVGDSFTFGDQVSDDETWSARLEEISNTRVINGGVFGYGVDQSFMRMKALASKYQPDTVIFSFIPGDIYRCELSERTSVKKPYFELSENGDLVLMKEHISPPVAPGSLDIFRKVMGYSFLAHKLVSKAFSEYWLQGTFKATRVHSKGVEITCRIFEQLKRYVLKENITLYILVQYPKDAFEKSAELVDEVIACIDQDVLEVVDLRASLAELKEDDVDRYESFFDGHMTSEGNDFLSSLLWETISKRNGMPNKTM